MKLAEALKTTYDAIRNFFNENRPNMKNTYFVVDMFYQANRSAAIFGGNLYLDILTLLRSLNNRLSGVHLFSQVLPCS